MFAHHPDCRLTTRQQPEDVGLEHLFPVRGVRERDRFGIADTGVVHHHVESAGRCRCVRNELIHLFGDPDVHDVSLCGSSGCDDALDRLLHRSGASSSQDHMGVLGTERLGDGAADATRRARDHSGAP
jgi:hypothetical protein